MEDVDERARSGQARNDLAERALRLADSLRRAVVADPWPLLSVLGALAMAVVVVAGGRAGAAAAALPLDRWLGLLPPASYQITAPATGAVMLAGIAVLLVLWAVAVAVSARSGDDPSRRPARVGQVRRAALAWALPVVVGPPLLSTGALVEVAHGLLQRIGLSPYHHGPGALDTVAPPHAALVGAIDPTVRATLSTAGPAAALVEHVAVAVAGGSPWATVLVLRAVAILAVVSAARSAARLAGPQRAPLTTCITALSPATLLIVVSGADVVGIVAALLLGAAVALRAGRPLRAVALAAVAAATTPVAVVGLVTVVVLHARRPVATAAPDGLTLTAARVAPDRATAARRVVVDTVLTALLWALAYAAVPHALDALGNLDAVLHDRVAVAPSSLLADGLHLVVRSASSDDLLVGGRVSLALAAVVTVVWLLTGASRRGPAATLGGAVLALVLAGPVVHAGGLVLALLVLAPAVRHPVHRVLAVALGAAACVLTPSGFGGDVPVVVTGVAVGLIAAVGLAGVLLARARS